MLGPRAQPQSHSLWSEMGPIEEMSPGVPQGVRVSLFGAEPRPGSWSDTELTTGKSKTIEGGPTHPGKSILSWVERFCWL